MSNIQKIRTKIPLKVNLEIRVLFFNMKKEKKNDLNL